jgi:ribonuclease BN (tRNA processing enzyme)
MYILTMGNHKTRVDRAAAHSSLPLANDGSLTLHFIGAGSAFTKKYYQNNLLIIKGQDHLLVDCGTRTPEALARLGLSVMDIRNYLITHSHADHIGGLEEVMLLNRYVARSKPVMVAPASYRRFLWEKSLKGGAAYNERNAGRWLQFADLWDSVDLQSVPGADRELCEARIGSIKVSMFRTMHIPGSARSWRSSVLSYGVVIDDRILFSSDTRFDPQLFPFLARHYAIETIFHDCQFLPGGVHASLQELATLPPDIKTRTWLMHYGDVMESLADTGKDYGFAGFVQQWTPYTF